MTVVAHAGHWALNLIYAAPILALVVLLVRDRMRKRASADDPDPGGRD